MDRQIDVPYWPKIWNYSYLFRSTKCAAIWRSMHFSRCSLCRVSPLKSRMPKITRQNRLELIFYKTFLCFGFSSASVNLMVSCPRISSCAVGALSQSQAHPLLGSLALPGRPLQPQTHAQLEHFLPLRVNTSPPLSLFPNFNTVRHSRKEKRASLA